METIRWKIAERLAADQAAVSLRTLLHDQWLLPNRYIHYLRRRRHVLVNNHYQYMNMPVAAGDLVELFFVGDEFRTPTANQYVPARTPHLSVLFANRDLIVVNKPAGEKSHPNQPGENGTVMNDVAAWLAGTASGAYMVHRLDQQTSGAMIVAKNPIVVPVLDRLISNRQIHRQYLAVVSGRMTGAGELNWPIGRDPTDQRKRQVNGPGAQPARTHYQVLAANDHCSLVSLRLDTGRTHQLRVHLAHCGHPIIGDPLYGRTAFQWMLLHGVAQQLVLPFSFKKIKVQAPVPPYFADYLLKYNLG